MPLTREALGTVLVESFGPVHAGRVLDEYPRGADGLNDLGSDLVFGMPSVHLAERQALRAPTYLYRLEFASRLRALGSFHAIELTQLFPSDPRIDRLLFGRPTAERDAFGTDLRSRWLQFVRDGVPGDGWPAYEPDGDRATYRWDLSSGVEQDPRAARRVAWAGGDATIH